MEGLQLVVCFLITALLAEYMAVHGAATEPVAGDDVAAGADNERLVYDQRQSGKYNIHISIKDVAIIEMNQNEIEELDGDDYYYDEGDLTVKPLPWLKNQTTTTPVTTTTTITENSPTVTSTSTLLGSLSSIPHTASEMPSQHVGSTSYSPNLLAAIAATEAANAYANITSATSTTINSKKPPNVVILTTSSPQYNSPSSTHNPPLTVPTIELKGRTKDDRLSGIFDSVLLPTRQHYKALKEATDSKPPSLIQQQQQTQPTKHQEQRNSNLNIMSHEALKTPHAAEDSKVYKFKMRRAHQVSDSINTSDGVVAAYPTPIRAALAPCRHSHYRDVSGNCRSRRTPSSPTLFKRIFHMLLALPFAATEREHDFGSVE